MKKISTLILCALLALAFLCSSVFPAAAPKDEWLQVRSKNFFLIGNASEKDIRRVATRLEQFRETFRQLFTRTNLSSPIATNVVVFKSSSAYKPFKPKRADGKIDDFVAGYFQPGEDINYITLSTDGEDADIFGTIFHEYVHFIVNTNFGKSEVPPWFNEGLAEYYQTFEIAKDQEVKLGLPQSGHLLTLQQNKLIPLETLFKINNYSLHQNGNHSRSVFYAQSWALMHYLLQGGKSEGLSKFLDLSMKNVPAEKAFQDSFQMNYAQMEKELKKYVAQNSYKYSFVSFKNKLVFDAEMQISPLDETDSNAYLGDLLYHTNRADDAGEYLQKAVDLKPDSSMANTTFGMVKMRQRKYDEAKNYFEKAIAKDQKNHLAFYQYAYLLSREGRDEFGFVNSFPKEQSAKMRDLLKKSIAINPSFTESYEMLAFVSLVNNENLDEAVTYLLKALKYQPGNQRYAIRIAEIYLRQEKFDEAAKIADKILKTTDEPEVKMRAENLAGQIQQHREIYAVNEDSRKKYETAIAEAKKNGREPIIIRRAASEKELTPAELAKIEEERSILFVNQTLRKTAANEKQSLGRIQKVECKNPIVFTVKTDTETFTLTSKDFENLALMAFDADAQNSQIGCDANLAAFKAVVTYKPLAVEAAKTKTAPRGELVAIDFVPQNFKFMDAAALADQTANAFQATEEMIVSNAPSSSAQPPPPAAMPNQDFDRQRRAAMMAALKGTMRQPEPGETRALGTIEKIECTSKGAMFFHLKTGAQILKLNAVSPQSVQLRSYTAEAQEIQFGCGLKQVDIPVVFTYKATPNQKNKTNGEIVALEFVPKSFTLD